MFCKVGWVVGWVVWCCLCRLVCIFNSSFAWRNVFLKASISQKTKCFGLVHSYFWCLLSSQMPRLAMVLLHLSAHIPSRIQCSAPKAGPRCTRKSFWVEAIFAVGNIIPASCWLAVSVLNFHSETRGMPRSLVGDPTHNVHEPVESVEIAGSFFDNFRSDLRTTPANFSGPHLVRHWTLMGILMK